MFVSHKDRIRHDILIALNAKTNGQAFIAEGVKYSQWAMPLEELLEKAGITDKEYRQVVSLLFTKREIKIIAIDGKEHIYIRQAGLTALNEESYLKESKRQNNLDIVNYVNWIAPVVVGVATIITLYLTIVDITDIKEEIKQLKQELLLIKAQPTPKTQSKIFSGGLHESQG